MSTPSRASTPSAGAARRPSVNPSKSQTTPSRNAPSATSSPAAAKLDRVRSVRSGTGAGTPPPSARAAVRKSISQPARTNMADSAAEEDVRAGAAAAMDDMRERLQKAELAVEEHIKQAAVLQTRLDDANKEHSKLEETVHEHQERMEELENEKKENIRKRREIEAIYEAEQASTIKEREEAQSREDELRTTVQRLKDSMAQKELRVEDDKRLDLSRTSSFRSNASPKPDASPSAASASASVSASTSHFAPPSSLERSDSRSSSRLLLQKDKIIESLRLELAEAQIKIAELESIGGGRVQELEKSLLDARVTNARLMEDNESFQLLLAEKTISGDFGSFLKPPSDNGSRPPSRDAHVSSSLADELESATELDVAEHRRLISEVSALRDQNKALSLYINNIISRLLQHKEFENILDKTPNLMSGSETQTDRSQDANVYKDLPPPPPEDAEAAPPSLLQRATSVVRGRPRPQTMSQTPSQSDVNPSASPAMTEDPATAPRVPLGRPGVTRVLSGGHRRANSEWSHAAVVSNMYRGPSPASGQISPGVAPQRASTFFSATPASSNNNPAAMARIPSGSSVPRFSEGERRESVQAPASNRDSKISSSRNSIISEPDTGNPSSPPRSTMSASEKPSGAIMGGNKMRPLRLVQEANEQEEATKKANRSSWMGWFNKGGPGPKTGSGEGE